MNGRLLGLDFGLSKIGVATGNCATATAQALTTVAAQNGVPAWRQLDAVVSQWRPQRLILGLPLMMDGSEQEMAVASRRFGAILFGRYRIPVVLVDERLSSKEADFLLRKNEDDGHKKSRRSKRIDYRHSVAAELILQTYLNDNPAPL